MAANETYVESIRNNLEERQVDYIEKKMFGGVAFMIQDKMCIGVTKEQVMLRVIEQHYEALLEENYVNPMTFTGRVMKNFLFLDPEAFDSHKKMDRWVDLALEFSILGVIKSKKKKK